MRRTLEQGTEIKTNLRLTTKKAAGVGSGGGSVRSSIDSGFDGVGPLIADLLTGNGQSVFLRERASCAEHRSCGVLLPAHRGHDLLKRGAAFAFEHGDYLAGLASLPRCAGVGGPRERLLHAGGLGLRRTRFRRDVGCLCANVGLRCVGWNFGLTLFFDSLGSFCFESGRLLSRFGTRRSRRSYRGGRAVRKVICLNQGLDRLPDTRDCSGSILELGNRGVTRNAVPNLI